MLWYFGILYVFRFCHGLQVLKDIADDLYIINSKMTYQNTKCLNNSRILSYSDLTRMKERNLTWAGYVWINDIGAYTPWLEYNGIKRIRRQDITRNKTISENGKQLSTCVNYCEMNWRIGLQVDTCFCLTQDPIPTTADGTASTCTNSTTQYIRCAGRNNEGDMAVYTKGTNVDKMFGECLAAETNGTQDISLKPTYCSSVLSVQCIFNKTFTKEDTLPLTREAADKYCSKRGRILPGRIHLGMDSQAHRERFWLSEIREHYFLQGEYNDVNRTSFSYHCVSGQSLNGHIKLHPTNCTDQLPVICIKPKTNNAINVSPAAVVTPRVTSDKIGSTQEDSHEDATNVSAADGVFPSVMTTSYTVESTAEDSHEDSNWMVIILVSVGGFVVLVITIVVIVFLKRRRQTAHTSEPVPSAVYASVQKTQVKTSSEPCTSNTSRNTSQNETKLEENNDPMQENTYDHTNFTLRQSVQQPDVSNYDTMESVQIVGESIYSRSDSVRTTGEKTEFVEDDSIYNQTFVVAAKEQSNDEQVPALTDSFSYQ